MIGYIEGPPISEGSGNMTLFIKVRNVESRLWAYAPQPGGPPGSEEQTEPMDVRLESDNIQFDPNELVCFSLLRRIEANEQLELISGSSYL